MAAPATNPISFLDLSLELRNVVYQEIIGSKPLVASTTGGGPPTHTYTIEPLAASNLEDTVSTMRTCHKIHDELVEMLNSLVMTISLRDYLLDTANWALVDRQIRAAIKDLYLILNMSDPLTNTQMAGIQAEILRLPNLQRICAAIDTRPSGWRIDTNYRRDFNDFNDMTHSLTGMVTQLEAMIRTRSQGPQPVSVEVIFLGHVEQPSGYTVRLTQS